MRYSPYRKLAKEYYLLRWIARWYHAYTGYHNWSKILAQSSVWAAALHSATNGVRLIIPTCVGGHIGMTHIESILAVALTLRGANVEFLLCDSALPACVACEIGYLPYGGYTRFPSVSSPLCRSCFAPANRSYAPLRLRVHRFSNYLTEDDKAEASYAGEAVDLAEISKFRLNGLGIGEQAYAGALRFFARGDLVGSDLGARVQKQYVQAALLTARVMQGLLEKQRYDCAVFNHGIYVPQGIVGDVCRKSGLRIVNWNPAYKTRCFIFSHTDSYHHTMPSEPIEKWERMEWNEGRESRLKEYLEKRQYGTEDWIWFNENALAEVDDALLGMGVRPEMPLVGLLTSVMWDAALHYSSNAFKNQLDWVFSTIDYFRTHPKLQLLIRIHPAEIQGGLPSRQRIQDEIRSHYPNLPKNVFVVPPESRLSTYTLMERCNAVIIYNTKTGIELAAMGIPVIVAGEAWIRNKGFATDVSNPGDYFRVLDRLPLPGRMSPADTLRAKKYAYHFFFRRMIPLEFMEPTGGNPPFRINLKSIDELMPGRSRGLDVICDGILHGSDFIFDA